MFTGIVEELGVIKSISHQKNLSVITIQTKIVGKSLKVAESLCVNGACLTVTSKKGNVLSFDMMEETLKKTSLGKLLVGDKVNLERALKADSRFNGHFVTGHVDAMVHILDIVKRENYFEAKIEMDRTLRPFLVTKGSVCVDGISLTIGSVAKDSFSVYIIPYTLKVTNLGFKRKGAWVNIETDILAKYILKSGRVVK